MPSPVQHDPQLPHTPAAATSHPGTAPVSLRDRVVASARRLAASVLGSLYASDIEEFYRASAAVAGAAGRRTVTVDDLAIVCLRDRATAAALARLGLKAPDAATAIATALEGAHPDEGAHDAWQRTWQRVQAARTSQLVTAVDTPRLLASCLLEDSSIGARVLAARGVTPRRVLLVHAGHDEDLDGGAGPRAHDGEVVDVVVLNDLVSKADHVCAALMGALELPHERSHALMLEVHTRGSSVVFHGPAGEAREAQARIIERATSCLAPLRVRLRRAGEEPSDDIATRGA